MGRRTTWMGAVLALLFMPACATVQSLAERMPVVGAPQAEREARDVVRRAQGKYVVVDLEHNELRFMDADRVLWSAPVGTGTGLQLRGENESWEFSTPQGVFSVQYKERDPVWILPDWHYVEQGRPIPSPDAKERQQPGALGVAAVYLGDGLSIHGTDKPELLGQRVSHGCIRLANENALRLFHNVQVGTPVVVVGRPREGDKVIPSSPGDPRPLARSPLEKLSTEALFRKLDRQIAKADRSSAWVETTSVLIARGIRDDAQALRGVLARAGQSDNEAFESEYATFVADAFARGTARAVVSLARIGEKDRARAARAIVSATMELYGGRWSDRTAPWPTSRIPEWGLGPDGKAGWAALAAAERELRKRTSMAMGGGGR